MSPLRLACLLALAAPLLAAAPRWNLLLVTADDLSCDSLGVYGCPLPGATPEMDRLAATSLRFAHAFVQVGNCMPSRNVMFSGRYPHNNRIEGFYQVRDPGWPHLSDLLRAAGYYTGIRHKVEHSTPYSPYPGWDVILDRRPDGTPLHQKDPASYGESARRGIAEARRAGKPFFLNLNLSDPHKPFFGEDAAADARYRPSRVFGPAEVPVPGFLFDDPQVRAELARYHSSVRRADDGLGAILAALRESGEEERTIVMFLSDHGMPLPFAKTQLYFHSTRTPWMVRWPGITRSGAVDDRHLVSGVDLMPTVLEMLGLPEPAGVDGRSFAAVLRGATQEGRDHIVAEYNENSGGHRHPMRTIITREHGYLFNPWSDGTRVMATATRGTATFRRMQELARTDPALAARLDLFEHRRPEELYHYASDPDALRNLIGQPAHRVTEERLTAMLEAWMVRTRDPLLDVFRARQDPARRAAFMQAVEAEAEARRAAGAGRSKGGGGKRKAAAKAGEP